MNSMFRRDATAVGKAPLLCLPEDASWTDSCTDGRVRSLTRKGVHMAGRVAIVAAAQTKYHPNRADVNEAELAYEAIKQVLEETGLTLSDIDSVVTCCQDAWDGRTIASLTLQQVVGAHFGHEFTVADDGINAA